MRSPDPRRRWRRGASALGVAVALLAVSACGSSGGTDAVSDGTGRPSATQASASGSPVLSKAASIKATAERLFPKAPTPAEARKAAPGCMANMMPGMDMTETTDFTARRASDGGYERVYGGKNPRVEVSSMPFDTKPTAAQSAAAATFVQQVAKAVHDNGWTDPANAVRDGYRPMQQCNSHYVNIDAVTDGRDLDPAHPEFLVIEPGTDGKNHLHSVMFMESSNTGHGPQAFGPLAIWHYHDGGGCQIDGVLEVPQTTSVCPKGTKSYDRTPEMLHVSLSGPPFSPKM